MTQYIKLALTGSVHKIAERKGAWVRAFMGDGTIKAFRGTQFSYVDGPDTDTAVTADEAFDAINARREGTFSTTTTGATAAPELLKIAKKPVVLGRARKPLSERKNGRVDPLYLAQYQQYRREDGVLSMDNGDDVAARLRKMELANVYAYAAGVLNVPKDELLARYAKLNPGMQRMNLGNRVRAFLRSAV